MNLKYSALFATLIILALGLSSCEDLPFYPDNEGDTSEVELKNHSETPAFVKNLADGVEVYSLISSEDTLEGSPDFTFGGSADGLGIIKGQAGSYTMLVNHEDNYSVSRIRLDKTFKPVHGEYLINSDQGRFRLCSATMAKPEVQGFGPLYFTAGESGVESLIHTVEPEGAVNSSKLMEGFGNWSAENAVPLPKEAVSGKTAVIIGDDPTKGSLELLLDGDDRSGPAGQFQNPDNIMATENYLYIQEDPNGYSRNADPADDETHDAYIYQYNIKTGDVKVVMELDHKRGNKKYHPSGEPGRLGGWEYGTMRDISDLIDIPNTFLLAIQPHTWTDDKYAGPDGGALRANENQASEVIVVKGLPR